MMKHVLKRGERFYFNRRVPTEYQSFDSREIVRVALKTDSRKEAIRLAAIQNGILESYWKGLIQNANGQSGDTYEKLIQLARQMGLYYMPNEQIAASSLDQLYARLINYKPIQNDSGKVKAVLGGVNEPAIKMNELVDRYVSFTKGKTLNKSTNQVRKWLNPRKLAMNNFIDCIGNKDLMHLSRDDIIKYKDWWITRIQKNEVTAGTANKNLVLLKTIIETVNENLNLRLDTKHLFNKLTLPDEEQTRRLPFEEDYIVNVLLNQKNLSGLNEQARWVLHAIAETGAGISEQVGLLPEDIVLDHEIPHIIITPRKTKILKTKYRKRIIPLVGFALDAFKACPNGFIDYADRPDSLSGALSKYLKENDLLPTENHTVYSLRHSFQDRLLAANAPDRVQADLMGHKFNRQAYGDGASLAQKFDWLKKIQLK